jgi:predicted DNA-binding transcriptional regulator AlpA
MNACETINGVSPATTAYLTHEEVAGLCRVSPQTLRRWRYGAATRDTFPRPLRIGRRLLFDAAEVRGFLERLRGGSGATVFDCDVRGKVGPGADY